MKTANIFTNGRSQAVRLPKEYRFDGEEVFIKKIDNIVMLIPKSNPRTPLMDSLNKFTGDYMGERDQPLLDKREKL